MRLNLQQKRDVGPNWNLTQRYRTKSATKKYMRYETKSATKKLWDQKYTLTKEKLLENFYQGDEIKKKERKRGFKRQYSKLKVIYKHLTKTVGEPWMINEVELSEKMILV